MVIRELLSFNIKSVTGKLIVANVIIYIIISISGGVLLAILGEYLRAILSILIPGSTGALTLFHELIFPVMLVPQDFTGGKYILFGLLKFDYPCVWELITSIFVHANIVHIGFNMLALQVLGSRFESILGSRRLLYTFFTGGIIANIATVALSPPMIASVGASGALFAVAGVIAIIEFRVFSSTQSLWWILLILIISSLPLAGRVNMLAHIVGLSFGLLIGLYYSEILRRRLRRYYIRY